MGFDIQFLRATPDSSQRERVLKAQVAAERLELKQQLQDIDISRIKRERQRAADMRHAFRAAEERLRSSIKHRWEGLWA